MGQNSQHPEDIRTEETAAFVTRHLPLNPARVLDVGCGQGRLSAALQALGHKVSAIDMDAEAIEAARGRGVRAQQVSLLDFEGGPFDTVCFSYSLHHIHPLSAAMDALAAMLAPGGRVIVEEFAFERVDDATAAWSLGMQDVLLAAGVLGEGDHVEYSDVLEGAGPLARWHNARERHQRARRGAHKHEPREPHGHAHEHWGDEGHLHEAQAMRGQLSGRFDVLHEEDGPGLWAFWLDNMNAEHMGTAQRLLALERALIAQGAIRPFGVRWVLALK